MKKTTLYLMLIALMGLMISCSEDDDKKDDDTPKDEMNYYPMATGSYWVYSETEVDGEGNETLMGYEKHEVENESELDGHSSYDVSTYEGETESEFEEEPSSTNTYYNDNGKVYVSMNFVQEIFSVQEFGLVLPITSDMASVKIIDQDETEWEILSESYDSLMFNVMGIEVEFTGTATLKAKYVGEKAYSNESLDLNGNAGAFEYIFELDGDIEGEYMSSPIESSLTISSTREHWYMNEIGLVSKVHKMASVEASNTILEGLINQQFTPTESRFNLVSSSTVTAE